MPLAATLIAVSGSKIGDIRWHAGSIATSGESVIRTGWLVANGASVLRTTYAALFGVIGTTYGSVDGTHFTLPNFATGLSPISKGPSVYTTRGATGGEATHTLNSSEEPFHTHSYVDAEAPNPGSGYGARVGLFQTQNYGGDRTDTTLIPDGHSGGAAAAHENMPPVQVVGGIIICYK